MRNSLLANLRQLDQPILVTGHTGFKGVWLTTLLRVLGVNVVGMSLAPEKDSLYERGQFRNYIPEVFGDIRDLDFVRREIDNFKPVGILHLAAQPLVIKSYSKPIETFHTNIIGTANILDSASKTNSVRSIGVVTTDKVYKNSNLGTQFVESDPLEGKDPYSASKVGTEAVTKAWQQISALEIGPEIISLRAGNVIGGGDFSENRLIPDVVRAKLHNSSLNIRNPKSTRPWQHVLDPLWGYLLALEKSLQSKNLGAFNFGPNERSLNVQEVIEELQKYWKLSINISNSIPTTTEAMYLNLDSSKAHAHLNWKPIYDQKRAILKTVEWWDKYFENNADPLDICRGQIEDYISTLS